MRRRLPDREVPEGRAVRAVPQRRMQIQEAAWRWTAAGRGCGLMARGDRQKRSGSYQADYGLDAPLMVKRMFTRGGWTLGDRPRVFCHQPQRVSRVRAERLLAVLARSGWCFSAVGGFMIWSSRVAKLAAARPTARFAALEGRREGSGRRLRARADGDRRGQAAEDRQGHGIDVWSHRIFRAIRPTRRRRTPSSKASRTACGSRPATLASWCIRRATTTW